MDTLLRLLLRLVVVPLGIAAGMVATLLVVVFGYWRIGDLLAGATDVQALDLYAMLATASFLLMAVVAAMWGVALIGIACAEVFAIRSWLFHALNGAVSAWVGAELFEPYPDTPVPFDGNLYIVGAGLAGGLAYWLIAGWSAGFWKPVGKTPNVPVATPVATPATPPQTDM